MDFYFKYIKSRANPSAGDVLEDIIEYHTNRPGWTEVAYGNPKTENGQTSYEILTQVINDISQPIVLDLACGNAPLIDLILRLYPDTPKVIGIDLCSSEIKAAQERINSDRVEFRCESVLNLSIVDDSIDCVLSHLAYFLFDPIEQATNEIYRVLKRGGKFSTITSGIDDSQEDYNQIVHILQSEVAKKNPNIKNFGWGDSRMLSKEGIQSLFIQNFDSNIEFSNFNLIVFGRPAELTRQLLAFFYASDLLDDDGKTSVLHQWTNYFEEKNQGAEFRLNFPLTRLVATKR